MLSDVLIRLLILGSALIPSIGVDGLSTPPPSAGSSGQALAEWLRTAYGGDGGGGRMRCSLGPVEIGSADVDDDDDDDDKLVVAATKTVVPGEVLFRLSTAGVWSASAAYDDRDLGPRLRDLAGRAGPGFGSVALAGALAAERVRRYRSREGQGRAPESTGYLVPSRWGDFARRLWSLYEGKGGIEGSAIDESLADVVMQGVNLLVPLLDVAARRAWSGAEDAPGKASFLSEEWARRAMFDDGSSQSWSRADLERAAIDSFSLVLGQQRPPPPYLLEGVGTLIPDPFVGKSSPRNWPDGEPLALVPLVDDLFDVGIAAGTANAVLGSPPEGRGGDKAGTDCIWCVATRQLGAGDRIIASNPWE